MFKLLHSAPRSAERDESFLAALCDGLSIFAAARAAGYTRRAVYAWREVDEEFRAAWDDARECGTDVFEDEARRRAYVGVEDAVFYGGKRIETVRRWSDTLLQFLLRARRPEHYRERAGETARRDAAQSFEKTVVILPDNGRD